MADVIIINSSVAVFPVHAEVPCYDLPSWKKDSNIQEAFQPIASIQKTSLIPFTPQKELKVEKIDRKECSNYEESLQGIIDVAIEKIEIASELDKESKDVELFSICGLIWEQVVDSFQNPKENQEFYFCKDEKENIQGSVVVQINDADIYVELLVTHPRNIRSSLNEKDPEKVQGAGSELLKKVEDLAHFLGKSQVSLEASTSALSFYSKMGYQKSSSSSNDMFKRIEGFTAKQVA